jgi:hypothetical protein
MIEKEVHNMAKITAEECIHRILVEIEKRKSVDYADKRSVRRYNAAYDRIYANAKYINDNYPSQLTLLVELFSHPDLAVVTTCAPLVFRLDRAKKEQKLLAIDTIKKAIQDPRMDSVSRLGFTMSLRDWEQQV